MSSRRRSKDGKSNLSRNLTSAHLVNKRSLPSNNSFNPNLLRYSNNMAEKACHVVASTAQVGLTQALDVKAHFRRVVTSTHISRYGLLIHVLGLQITSTI